MIPGMNLLNIATGLIATQSVQWLKLSGTSVNQLGFDDKTYDAPVTIKCSAQPVPRNRYEQYGLDFQKNYTTFYTSNNVIDLSRISSGDLFHWNNKKWQVVSNNDWYSVDGWAGILAVDIGAI